MDRLLRVAALVEVASLGVLLLNLATVHLQAVAGLLGPLHGCAYLAVIAAALQRVPGAARWWSLVPGVGGLLVLRRLRTVAGAQPDG